MTKIDIIITKELNLKKTNDSRTQIFQQLKESYEKQSELNKITNSEHSKYFLQYGYELLSCKYLP